MTLNKWFRSPEPLGTPALMFVKLLLVCGGYPLSPPGPLNGTISTVQGVFKLVKGAPPRGLISASYPRTSRETVSLVLAEVASGCSARRSALLVVAIHRCQSEPQHSRRPHTPAYQDDCGCICRGISRYAHD